VTRLVRTILLLLFVAVSSITPVKAEAAGRVLTVAVASNALRPVQELAGLFEERYGVKVRISSGSTGKLYTQITQGAPFHVFFAADKRRPELLEEKGLIERGSRFTYAVGALIVWTKRPGLDLGSRGLTFLKDARIRRIAVANPSTAPYGRAAVEALERKGILKDVQNKFVYGENVSQAFNFARTGNADVCIVALSTIYGQDGSYFPVDGAIHSPIVQQAVILRGAPPEAREFTRFLSSPDAVTVFSKYGYSVAR